MPHALIVDDDPHGAESLAALVAENGFTTACADSLQSARDLLASAPDVILLDLILPDGNGLELLREEALRDGDTQVVVVTGHATLESAIEAMRRGATDYLMKPHRPRAAARRALPRGARPRELSARGQGRCAASCATLGRFGRLVGALAADAGLYDLIARVAPTDATVLITGESGTGKEVVAQTIHELSRAPTQAVPRRQLRRDLAAADRERAVRPREAAASPAPTASTRATSSARTAARCSSTRSPRCRSSCR